MRNLLTTFPSTPVTNEGAISNGKDVDVGAFDDEAPVDEWGWSNAILATGSPSRSSSEGNLRDISLKHMSELGSINVGRQGGTHLLYLSTRLFWYSNSRIGLPVKINSRKCSSFPLRPAIRSISFHSRIELPSNDKFFRLGR